MKPLLAQGETGFRKKYRVHKSFFESEYYFSFLKDIPEELALEEKAGRKQQEEEGEQMSLFDFI